MMNKGKDNSIIEWTGERYVPWVDLITPEIHYEHIHRYSYVQQFVEGKKVLDLASGEGYGCAILAEKASEVVGIDIDEQAVRHAVGQYLLPNINFICGSITDIPIKGENLFDVITCFEAMEHIEDHDKLLSEVKRLLTKEGLFIVSTPNKLIYNIYSGGPNLYHLKELNFDEFKNILEKHFPQVSFLGQKVFPVSSIWPIGKSKGNYTDFCVSKDKNGFVPVSINNKIPLYFIGIATQASIENFSLFSTLTDVSGEIFNSFRRIIDLKQNNLIELQNSFENKEKDIKNLEISINQKEKKISEIKELYEQFVKLNQVNEGKIAAAEIELQNKQGHIEQLLEQERLLNNILDSRGWRLLQRCYHLKNKALPLGSRRRLLAKIVYKAITNPRIFFGSINTSNIRKFFYYLKTEDVSRVENKIENYLIEHTESKGLELQFFKPTKSKQKISFIKHDNPLVSIIIPVYNQWEYTYSCLKSIFENTNGIAYEIIIADDVSTDETVNILDYVENIMVVRNQENKGFLLNCNNAASFVKGKYIVFLNNDTNVQKDWLLYLVNLIEHDDSIGLVGSKLVYADGRLQEAGGIIWKDASGWNYGHFDDPDKPEYNYVKEVDYISGAAIMIRNGLWREIGGFDERYAPAYFEDADLAFEVRKKNYKVVYQPKSLVVHFEGVSHGTDDNAGIKNYQVKNREKFIEKWKDKLEKNQLENGQDVFWARDRSKGKKTILVIDHYVPHYDKDAGSRTTFQYLKLFVDKGLNVKFVGDNFYQHVPYTTKLLQMGIEVLYGDWYAKNFKDWLKRNGRYIDYTFLNRPHISIKYVDLIKKYTNSKIIYYGHDLHYLREFREYQIFKDPALLKSSNDWKKIEFEIFEKSNVVYYPSQVEVDEILKYYPDKKVKAIPAYIFDNFDDEVPEFEKRKDLLFVGGFAHRPNIDAMIWFVEEIFPLVLERIPDIKLYIVGSNPTPEIKKYNSENVIVTGYVTDEELLELYKLVKLIVVPLRYGAGVKGKVVEAMYNKVPVVTTSIGAEGLIDIEDALIIADDKERIANKIVEYYFNTAALMEISVNSYSYVKKYFTSEKVISIISEDIN